MDADGWDASLDSRAMIGAVTSRVSLRRWRLYLAGAVRDARRYHLLPAVANACSLAERYADGLLDATALREAERSCSQSWTDTELPILLAPDAELIGLAFSFDRRLDRLDNDPARRLMWLREVIGNPFRWVRWEDDWLTPTVHTLAADAYARGQFDGLPILADAVEDAGCDNAELLAHLRGKGPHARGCWALDVILGKV